MSTEFVEDISIDEKIEKTVKEPGKYKIIFLNDNATPMEWVIEVLKTVFHHSQEISEKLTLQIHNEGSAIVGIYSWEVAEQKAVETTTASRDRGFPLQLKVEEE